MPQADGPLAPASRTARAASTSSSVPGKVMTPTRALMDGSRVTDQSLDHGVGEQRLGDLGELGIADRVVHLEFESLALPHI